MDTAFLTQSVGDFLERHSLAGGPGVIALSGGPDSVCLARIARDLCARGSIARVVFAHVNHQLRGAESDADEAFVRDLGREWGLACRVHHVDTAAALQGGANLEDTARRLRYEWLAGVARAEGATWVATGHSADDQAETILFRLLRGSGLQGLAGMAERRELAPGVDLIRPLLFVRRRVIQNYLSAHGQLFRQDSSNQNRHFTRNRLRHDLLPLLAAQYNPAIQDVLCRLGEQARETQLEIVGAAERLLASVELPRAGNMVVLDVLELARASLPLRREVFRLVWQRENWPARQMTFEAWNYLAKLADALTDARDFPGRVHARRTGRVVQLTRTC